MERSYKIVKQDRKGLDAIRRPTSLEVAWAAGIYEGEGSCVAAGNNKNSFAVMISQKDPELLYRMRDLFGGSVQFYDGVGKDKRFSVYHWRICGDRGRTFIGVVYPYLTARRKEQVCKTPACNFIEIAKDLLVFDTSVGNSEVYEKLWERIREYDVQQKKKAAEHKKSRELNWAREKYKNDPNFRQAKAEAKKRYKKNKKEQLQVELLT